MMKIFWKSLVIGTNIPRLQKHVKKIFAGVHISLINEDNSIVQDVVSKEREEVHFYNPISIIDPSINEWLTKVEKEINLTLTKLLSRTIPELIPIQTNLANNNAFVQWLNQYLAQLRSCFSFPSFVVRKY